MGERVKMQSFIDGAGGRTFGVVVLAVLSTLLAPGAQAASPQRHAVIIGINDYADPAIPDLKFAESDAKAIYDTLIDQTVGKFPKDNVALLLGKDATNDKIKAALYKLRGVFTHFLVGGLRGLADTNADGAVTFDELWTYLGENVRKTSVKQGGLHEPVIITDSGITPQFLLTWNPRAVGASNESLKVLRKLFDDRAITGAQYDEGRKALTEPAIDAAATARREVYADLAAGRLSPKYLQDVLARRMKEAEIPQPAAAPAGEKPAIAIVPFEVYGNLRVKDAGVMLAERILPLFGDRYTLIDQMQLRRFVEQDDLTIAGLAQAAQTPATKGLTKAVKLRAVRYLVVGSVSASPDGRLSITARLSDWQTGRIESGRLAQIAGDNWDDLVRRLPLLAAKLTGSLGEIGAGPNVALPPLPTGVDALTARILQLEAIEAELKKAQDTLTDKHPRLAFLRENLAKLRKPLAADVDAKLKELQAADAKLADLYKEGHPQRAALNEQMAELGKAKAGILMPSLLEELLGLATEEDKDKLTLDLGGGVTMKLVLIPAGKFMMGSPASEKDRDENEGPQHEVTISKPFYMGVYEVTQEQYEQIIGKNPSRFKGAKNPVECVARNDAVWFCKKLSQNTGKIVSLPTEAQWEYACRAGTKTRFGFGDKDEDLGDYAWWGRDEGNSGNQTHPVGQKKPNAWGLYDMHGNVDELCGDWYADSYANAKNQDPTGPDSGTKCVLRGGNWFDFPQFCRSANRSRNYPDNRLFTFFGFRVVVLSGEDGLEAPVLVPVPGEPVRGLLDSVLGPKRMQIDQSLAKASMFLVNAKKISDLDLAEVNVNEGKKLLDANRQSLSPEEYAKQLSKINDMLSEITKKRRVLAETKVESQ